MTLEVWIGIGLTLAAGLMSGNCMLPLKFVRKWHWENTWLIFSVVSLIVIPWLLALSRVSNLGNIYASLSAGQLLVPFLFGFGWGIAQVLFGLSIARLGLALGYAVIVGLGALGGTLVPLFFQRREVLATSRGSLILSGVAVMLAGIAVSGWAGRLRERGSMPETPAAGAGANYGTALLVAVICGVMAPMINYSLAFGQAIADQAVRAGNTAANGAYAVWPISLAGGVIPNVGYSIYLLNRNGTWGAYRMWLPDLWFAGLMGVLWMGAFSLYGVSAAYLGTLGTSVGWALFQIFMIMTANISGVVTGEWALAGRNARSLLWVGLALLAAATVIISLGNR